MKGVVAKWTSESNDSKKISNKNRNEDDDESQIQAMATRTGVPWVRFKRLHELAGLAPKKEKRSSEEKCQRLRKYLPSVLRFDTQQ